MISVIINSYTNYNDTLVYPDSSTLIFIVDSNKLNTSNIPINNKKFSN